MKLLYFGDIIGKNGLRALDKFLSTYLKENDIDFIFANGENLAGGKGITKKYFLEAKRIGIDGVSTGNHVFDKREIYGQLKEIPEIIRPLNYPVGTPGKGFHIFMKKNMKVGLINVCGRVFMKTLDCPFRSIEAIIGSLRNECETIIVDIHGEATSEKKALGYFIDGKVTAVLGTHTHTQTNDSQFLPNKTFYMTDLGMVGAKTSVLGVKKEVIINHFLTSMPFALEVAEEGLATINGIELDIDVDSKVTSYKVINQDV